VPAITAAVGADFDLEEFAVGRAGKHCEGLAALRTRLLVGWPLQFLEDDGPMAVVAAWWTGPAALLAAEARWLERGVDGSLVWPVGGFGLAAKELALAQTELGAQVFEFVLEFGEACASALMHGLPVRGLLAEFEVLGAERAGIAGRQRRGSRHALQRRRGRGRTRLRCKIHTTSMNSAQL